MDDEMKHLQKQIIEKKRTINTAHGQRGGGGTEANGAMGSGLSGINQSQYTKQIKILESRLNKAN